MITLVLTLLWLAALPAPRPRGHRVEVCPGATYFINHGEHASWTPHKRLLCHIGDLDFYGDKR